MTRAITEPAQSKTRRSIVKLLKSEGAMDAAQMGKRLGLTAMAVRQHLYELQQESWWRLRTRPVPPDGLRSTGN